MFLHLPSLPQGFWGLGTLRKAVKMRPQQIWWQVWLLIISCTSQFVVLTLFNPWHGLARPRLAHTKQSHCSGVWSGCQQQSSDQEQTRQNWSRRGGAGCAKDSHRIKWERQTARKSKKTGRMIKRKVPLIMIVITCKVSVFEAAAESKNDNSSWSIWSSWTSW